MYDKIKEFFNNIFKKNNASISNKTESMKSKSAAKDRLHIVLMQDRANISADFLDLMRKEIIEVIKKYIVVDENEIDVRLTHSIQEDGTSKVPSLYANIPIVNIRQDMKALTEKEKQQVKKEEEKTEVKDKEGKEDKEKKTTETKKVATKKSTKKVTTKKAKEIKK